jgi:heptosyltransferase I
LERFVELLKRLHQHGAGPFVFFGGPSERERQCVEAILQGAQVPVLNLVGRTRIPELIASLARCRLLIAPDTGAVHIANALGRPVVGLYAVAPTCRTGPYKNAQHCVDKFDEAVTKFLGQAPASVSWSQRVHDPRAMQLITVAEIFAQIELILSKS